MDGGSLPGLDAREGERLRPDLALFDFDGTITMRETYGDFLHAVVPARRLAVGKVVLAPLVAGYRLGLVRGTVVRACIAWFALRGLALADVEARAERFAREVLPPLVRPNALERIDWHRERGDTVVVVSGNFCLALAPWCERQGLELIASNLECRGGVLTGRYRGGQCVGEEKPRRVRAVQDLACFSQIHAYGDTAEDMALLAMAHRRTYCWQPCD
ncbi:MAG: HAD-IB family hydrolase [Pseudomonadota bacterium]|nr:HAD-IB family hydrolase [Pseudomonadota bacterium]